jgi:hypothetical protein
LPAAERLEALRVQVRTWQPFNESGYLLSLRGDTGLAMAWDRRSAQRDLEVGGRYAHRCRLIPEPLLRKPAPDGAHLVRCIDGVEGQIWREGWLYASRWWPAPPNGHDWRLFLHASATSADDLAKAEPPELLVLPRVGKSCLTLQALDGSNAQMRGLEGRLMALGGLAVVVGATALSRQALELHQAIERAELATASLRQSTAVVLASRDQALAKAAQAKQMAAWLTEVQPIEVLVHLSEMIGKSGAQIKEMDLTGSKLRLGLQLSPQATRAGLVKDLQAGGWFKSVAEVRDTTSRGLVVMEMVVDGLRPPPTKSVAQVAARAAQNFPPASAFEAGPVAAPKAGAVR